MHMIAKTNNTVKILQWLNKINKLIKFLTDEENFLFGYRERRGNNLSRRM